MKLFDELITNLVNLHLKLVHVKEAFHLWVLNPQYHTYDKDFEYFHRYQILLCKEIGKNNNTLTVQAESSKFASVLFDQAFQIWGG